VEQIDRLFLGKKTIDQDFSMNSKTSFSLRTSG